MLARASPDSEPGAAAVAGGRPVAARRQSGRASMNAALGPAAAVRRAEASERNMSVELQSDRLPGRRPTSRCGPTCRSASQDLARWQEMKLFQRLRSESKGRPNSSSMRPALCQRRHHIGHALTNPEDVVNRSQQMLGKDANYVPAWMTACRSE